jgi:hypothetical protein
MTQLEQVQVDFAFREGIFVRALGRPISGNPYPKRSAESAKWEAGWGLIDHGPPARPKPPGADIAPSNEFRSRAEMFSFFVFYLGSLIFLSGLLLWCLLLAVAR